MRRTTKLKLLKTTSKRSKSDNGRRPTEVLSVHNFNNEEKLQIQAELLLWYDENKRDLPWRNLLTYKDQKQLSYAVWISEVMLQQTQVSTVIDYYQNWMKKWPTIEALAKATLEEVHEMWSGLGYYSRGNRLLEGAQKLVQDFNGHLPKTLDLLIESIPGVGRYTAAAISSIAFGQVTGVVDGNVVRVLSRLRYIGGDSKSPKVMNHMWDLVNNLVDSKRPGDFNQAIMELGATVCTPKTPSCGICPLQLFCNAYKKVEMNKKESENRITNGSKIDMSIVDCDIEDCFLCLPASAPWDRSLGVMNFPKKRKKKDVRIEKLAVCIVYRINEKGHLEYFIIQRPNLGLLANLWEFPNVVLLEKTSQKEKKILIDTSLSDNYNIRVKMCSERREIGEVLHKFSHIHQTYVIESMKFVGTINEIKAKQLFRWVTKDQFLKSAISTAVKKIFDLFENSSADKTNSCKRICKTSIINNKKQKTLTEFFKS